ncbi:hypothetical protein IWW55_002309 [Coemansia sp. RSA 2706]|nr:hypothetical protein IWW55_002309 [Coemansia sp. RSA 2706]
MNNHYPGSSEYPQHSSQPYTPHPIPPMHVERGEQFSDRTPFTMPAGYRLHSTSDNLYPSTLLPSRQIQAHHHPYADQHPVKLLQSCDSCRRRKIRCSGEKPTCSSCVRYQEGCHYSPLATPRRRAGRRARATAAALAADAENSNNNSSGASSQGEPLRLAAEAPAISSASTTVNQAGAAANQASAASIDSGGSQEAPGDAASEMRRDMHVLASKFDMLNNKLDALIGLLSSRRSGDSDRSETNAESVSDIDDEGRDFASMVDKTGRFGLDPTNIGTIADIMSSIDRARGQASQGEQPLHQQGVQQPHQQQRPGTTAETNSALQTETNSAQQAEGLAAVPQAELVRQLETASMQEHLIETFYLNADVNTIAFIPRHIFVRLRREQRVPEPMLQVIMADACNYSEHAAVRAVGRAWARGHFIERAYRGLFVCLEYDSAEHCVTLLLFAMVISKAGLHRAWIMHSLSTQMAVRLRFNTLDSPLSAPAFAADSELAREWKRRVFWQLCTFDVLTATLSDLPPSLAVSDVRCRAPRALAAGAEDGEETRAVRMLGPAVVFCDDQETLQLQIDLLAIMCDVSALQATLAPDDRGLFPAEFSALYARIERWQQQMPHYAVIQHGALDQIARTLGGRAGLVFLALLCQYARILLCLIKDTWLPQRRALTDDERCTLAWTRDVAYAAAQSVHRLVPLVRGMRLSAVCPFISCVVFQACIVSLQACAWSCRPRRILRAVNQVQRGLEFLDHVAPRWGFAAVLTTSLRSLIVERGFGPRDDDGNNDSAEGAEDPGEQPGDEDETDPGELHVSPDLLRPLVEESAWERVLRTGEMPAGPSGAQP